MRLRFHILCLLIQNPLLQLVHNNYAPNSSLTVGNLTVKAWKDRLETELAKRVNASKQAGANRSIRHQSFNINAVGARIWRLKPLDQRGLSMLSE